MKKRCSWSWNKLSVSDTFKSSVTCCNGHFFGELALRRGYTVTQCDCMQFGSSLKWLNDRVERPMIKNIFYS